MKDEIKQIEEVTKRAIEENIELFDELSEA